MRRFPCTNRFLVEPDCDVAVVSESDIVHWPVLHTVLRLILRRHLGPRPDYQVVDGPMIGTKMQITDGEDIHRRLFPISSKPVSESVSA